MAVVFCYIYRHLTTGPAIAKALNLSTSFCGKWLKRYKETGTVNDKPGRGRKKLLEGQKLITAIELLKDKQFGSSERVANALNSSQPISKPVSSRTVRRSVRAAGYTYRRKKKVPYITAQQQLKRLKFAKANIRESWERRAVSDSKYFQLNSATGKEWQKVGETTQVPIPKNPAKVHVYMAATAWGATKPVFVTGTTGVKSAFINPRTKQPHKGVQSLEYQQIFQNDLLPDLQLIFANTRYAHNWIFQQDGATPHTAKASKQLINDLVPGGLLPDWPPNSPDLNWIENVWAWMERELRKRPVCDNVEQLKEALLDIWTKIPTSMLRNCVKSMQGRLEKVIATGGGYSGH